MYYEEKVINGVLCRRYHPEDPFDELTKEELTDRSVSQKLELDELKKALRILYNSVTG